MRSSLVAQQIEDLVLSLLWRKFDPWPGNFCMPWAQPEKKERKKYKKKYIKKSSEIPFYSQEDSCKREDIIKKNEECQMMARMWKR